jgi:tetratricopeptide (TPR) repeat protein
MTSLAVAYLRTNRNIVAKELLTSAIQIQPENNTAYQYLGFCYLRLGDVDKSTENYSKAVEINDMDWEAHRGLGVAYMIRAIDKDNKDGTLKVRLKSKAIEQWRLSLDIYPEQPRSERLVKLIQKYSE